MFKKYLYICKCKSVARKRPFFCDTFELGNQAAGKHES